MPPVKRIVEGLDLLHITLVCFGFVALMSIGIFYSLWRPSAKQPSAALQFASRHIYALGFAALLLLFAILYLVQGLGQQ